MAYLEQVLNWTADLDLAEAFRLSLAEGIDWSFDDLAAMLRQQLDLSLDAEIRFYLGDEEARCAQTLAKTSCPRISSLRQLLVHPDPPTDLLRIVKDYAKVCAHHPDRPLPRDLAKIIYYAVLLVAGNRGIAISNLSVEDMRRAVEWAREQPWLDAHTRQLFLSV